MLYANEYDSLRARQQEIAPPSEVFVIQSLKTAVHLGIHFWRQTHVQSRILVNHEPRIERLVSASENSSLSTDDCLGPDVVSYL